MKQDYFNSDIYGKIRVARSVDDVVSLSQQEFVDDPSLVRMWRGQGDMSWSIDSSAYRRLALTGRKVHESELLGYEEHLLDDASHKGYRNIEGRELTDLELLARLQHHGAATRLVDATKNILVALWFCVSNEIDKIGSLIGIHAYHLGV